MSSRADTDQKFIHVRCDEDLKSSVRSAAGAQDKSLSEYVRETLRSAADEDMHEATAED